MTWSVSSCFITLVVLFLWRIEDIAEACKCAPVHLQQAFCNADIGVVHLFGKDESFEYLLNQTEVKRVSLSAPSTQTVIRAKVVGVEVVSGNTKYDIQQIKMFKGPDRVIHAIYTSSSSASCGVTLEINKEYLFTGSLNTDGRMHIGMCDFIRYWDDLTGTQKKSLTQRYRTGCACTIIPCSSLPCPVSAPDECLWTDWLLNDGQSGPQAKYSACLMSFDGSCNWYRGMDPSKK